MKIAVAVAAAIILAAPAGALYIEGTHEMEKGPDGVWSHFTEEGLGAEVTFSAEPQNEWTLVRAHLENTSTPGLSEKPEGLLQGVFFNAPELTPLGINLADGGGIIGDTTPGRYEILGGWAYRGDIEDPDNPFRRVYGVNSGIANPGLDTFGKFDTFGYILEGNDELWPTHNPKGRGGIASPGGGTPDSEVSYLASPGIVIDFGAPLGFNPDESISGLHAHYGTSAQVIPEPATITLLGVGLTFWGAKALRRRRQ